MMIRYMRHIHTCIYVHVYLPHIHACTSGTARGTSVGMPRHVLGRHLTGPCASYANQLLRRTPEYGRKSSQLSARGCLGS